MNLGKNVRVTKNWVNRVAEKHIYELGKRIDIFFFLVSTLLFVVSCVNGSTRCLDRSRIEKEPGFIFAEDYVAGYEIGYKFGATNEEKAISSMVQIETAKKNYLNSKPPTGQEILAVLNSKDNHRNKVALGAMVLQPLPEYDVVRKIVSFLNHPCQLHRDFVSLALLTIEKDNIKDFQDLGDEIFQIAKKEGDDLVLARGIETLGKFNNPKYLQFIVKYLRKTHNPLFYYSSFHALKEMDDKYFQQVRRQLKKEGDLKTLESIDRTEDFWKRTQRPLPES